MKGAVWWIVPMTFVASTAWADPTVHVAPVSPIKPFSTVDQPLRLKVVDTLPEGQSFTLALDVPSDRSYAGSVELWPAVESKPPNLAMIAILATANADSVSVCDAGPKDDARQHVTRALLVVDVNGARSLQATIPPLQIATAFCVAYDLSLGATARESKSVASLAAEAARVDALASGSYDVDTSPLPAEIHAGLLAAFPAGTLAPDVESRVVDAAKRELRDPAVSKALQEFNEAEAAASAATAQAGKDFAAAAALPVGSAKRTQADLIAFQSAATAKSAIKAAEDASLKVRDSMASAVEHAVSALLESSPVTTRMAMASDRVQTPSPANLVDATGGAVVAFPVGSPDLKTVWLLPFLAARVHFVPIETHVRFSQQVGTPGQKFLQRFGVQLGVAVGKPNLFGQQTSPVFGTAEPMMGCSFRLTRFIELDAGALLFGYEDRNPASSRVQIGAAPYLSISLDINLVNAIRKATGTE